ncbi:WD repeat domain-containing protein [Tetrabaena socialis]|uniref:WD repeat domain-containing protein n=1 Tax=Tetrabaena socialis TaxID=47790 RepID=A0A2J8A3J3_9CHLO|nr:WD repeat domain-containing protein [Tetrabaena socialis]|eukprot:PNH07084.1 WD repeat domain-containing protein [Tetrabaena socialis]
MLPQPDGQRVWLGNGRGQVEALDLRRAPAAVVLGHALKGSAGSIRSLALHPTEPLIASVSLDRHLRVHSTSSRALLTRVYLKQELTGVAWLPPMPLPAAAAEPDSAAQEGEEVVEDRPQQKRRKQRRQGQ